MKKCKLYLIAILLLCCTSITAQDVVSPSDEEIAKKKEINKIKMSEAAVYADVMEIASDDAETVSSVHQKSHEMLQAHVIEVFAKRMKMNKKDVQEIWDVIDDKCQNIVVKKGDLFRVFSYIMKDAIGLGPKKPKEGDVEKYMEGPSTTTETNQATTQVATDSVETEKTVEIPQEVPAQPIDSVEQTTIEIPQEVPAQPVDSVAEIAMNAPQETPAIQLPQPESQISQPETPEVVKKTPVATTPVEQPALVTTVTEMPEKIKIIFDKGSLNEIVRYLNAEKQNHTLIYGNMHTMQNPEKCYIVIIDKTNQKVVAILSQGSNNRINYMNGQQDDLDNYKGGKHSAIFVQEY